MGGELGRRALLGLAAAAACDSLVACEASPGPAAQRRQPPAPSVSGAELSAWKTLTFDKSAHYPEPERAEVSRPDRGKKTPLLVALHGAGESGRGLPAGAGGWRDEYHLDRARKRLGAPPLTKEDLLGFVEPARLQALNNSLEKAGYEDLVVACPYTPRVKDRSIAGAKPFGAFVTQSLIPEAAKAAGVEVSRARTGIDGVSMGGRLAIFVGLSNPDVFGAVGTLQPAIRESDVPAIVRLAKAAREQHPVAIRLASSTRDPFLGAVKALSAGFREAKISHELVITPGPHDYVWNQGPGSYEMLLWHERVLRGLPPP